MSNTIKFSEGKVLPQFANNKNLSQNTNMSNVSGFDWGQSNYQSWNSPEATKSISREFGEYMKQANVARHYQNMAKNNNSSVKGIEHGNYGKF